MNWQLAQRNAFKSALAVALAYGIALALGWQNPVWAAFGVYFPRLPYFGMSLHKCLLRMGGTIPGAAVALAIVGSSAQDHWIALAGISLATGFWFFLTRRTADSYAFMTAGFTGYIVWSSVIFDPSNAFTLASYRVSETCLGIVIGTLISGLIWPTMEAPAIRQQLEALRKTLSQSARQMADAIEGDAEATATLSATAAKLQKLADGIESLFISANRNTFSTDWLKPASRVYVTAQKLDEHLSGLRSLLRQYPNLSSSSSAASAAGWLRHCADTLDQMDWAELRIDTSNETSPRYQDDIDRAIAMALDDEARPAAEITLAVAARDQLQLIADDIGQLVEQLEAADGSPDAHTQDNQVVGAAVPLEPLVTDMRHGLVTVLAMFAAGAFWFSVYIPAGGSVFQFAGAVQIILITAPIFPYRPFFTILLGTILLTFPVVFLVLPLLEGIVGLSIVIFCVVYLFALIQEIPGKQFLGLLGFATFTGMLMIQPQQANAATQLSTYLNAAIAQIVGGHISLIVSRLLMPTSAGRQLCQSVQRVLSHSTELLTGSRDDSPASHRESFDRERSRLLRAASQLQSWERRVAPSLPDSDARAIGDVVQSLQVTARALLALGAYRVRRGSDLSDPAGTVEADLRQESLRCLNEIRDGLTSRCDTSASARELIQRVSVVADQARALRREQSAPQFNGALSMIGHYQALAATLSALSAAMDECDFAQLTANRF